MSSNTTETDDHEYQVRENEGEDDEGTIEEEEQLSADDEQNELAHLQADADMPLDQLLELYSKNASTINNNLSEDEESCSSSEVDDDDDDRRHHLFPVNGELLPDNEDDDTEDSLYEPEIVKFINVGDDYQAHVASNPEYNSANKYCDNRAVPIDQLLWSPSSIHNANNKYIDEYLKTIHTEYPPSDDEISLQTLLSCQLNIQLALIKFRQLPQKTIYSYSAWSLAERQRFEEGLREYGKNFFKISVFKCPNRSVREVVHFYYEWKKSERYQLFIEEQQRMNSLTSVNDIIEKFIEEQGQQLCTAAGVVDTTKSTSFKFHTSTSSISFVKIHQKEMTTKRSFDQVDHDEKISTVAKKTSTNTKTTSAETTATIV